RVGRLHRLRACREIRARHEDELFSHRFTSSIASCVTACKRTTSAIALGEGARTHVRSTLS
ncbi:MAG TPA: hypothetical protein VH054_24335, partial [Polyangiaceae bacterium]|nr:hypothetical protein [Polyangiaceae bacterium]